MTELTKSLFTASMTTPFALRFSDGSLPLELVEVEGITADAQNEASFAVTFRLPIREVLPQGVYRVEHERTGPLDVFLVPIRQDERGLYLHAVFNRMGIEPPSEPAPS